jgi:hypothetical protein
MAMVMVMVMAMVMAMVMMMHVILCTCFRAACAAAQPWYTTIAVFNITINAATIDIIIIAPPLLSSLQGTMRHVARGLVITLHAPRHLMQTHWHTPLLWHMAAMITTFLPVMPVTELILKRVQFACAAV